MKKSTCRKRTADEHASLEEHLQRQLKIYQRERPRRIHPGAVHAALVLDAALHLVELCLLWEAADVGQELYASQMRFTARDIMRSARRLLTRRQRR